MENGKQNGEKLAQILQADWSYATVCAILIKQEHIGLINKILPEHQIIPLLVIIYNINNLAKNQQTIVYDAVVRIIDSWSKYTLAPEKLKYLRDQAWTAISCSLPSEFCAAKRLGVAIELLAQRTHVSHDAF